MYKCSKFTISRSEAHRSQYKTSQHLIGLITKGGMLEGLIVDYTASSISVLPTSLNYAPYLLVG